MHIDLIIILYNIASYNRKMYLIANLFLTFSDNVITQMNVYNVVLLAGSGNKDAIEILSIYIALL